MLLTYLQFLSRVHTSLKWIFNNLAVSLPIEEMQPYKAKTPDPFAFLAKQKPAVELGMISQLEEVIIRKLNKHDVTVIADLGLWIQAVSGVRLKHLKLAYPCVRTGILLKCFCIKGKQRGKREGFRFSVFAFFISRPQFCWADRFLDFWKRRKGGPTHGGVPLGMVFRLET